MFFGSRVMGDLEGFKHVDDVIIDIRQSPELWGMAGNCMRGIF